jgi:hypothetical protein
VQTPEADLDQNIGGGGVVKIFYTLYHLGCMDVSGGVALLHAGHKTGTHHGLSLMFKIFVLHVFG